MSEMKKRQSSAEVQDKKYFLSRYRDNEQEIRRLQEEILRWESLSQSIPEPGQKAGERVRTALEQIESLRRQLVEQVIERVRLREQIGEAIGTVPEERLQSLLRYRYIEGWTWERVAGAMHYSWRQVNNLHSKALAGVRLS